MFGSIFLAAFVLFTNTPHSTLGAAQQPQEFGDLTTLASSGEAVAGVGAAEASSEVILDGLTRAQADAMNAEIRAQQARRDVGKPRPFVPTPLGQFARGTEDTAPTEPAYESMAADLPAAPNDMTYFVNNDITAAEVSTGQRSTIMEPTTINLGTAAFYTGNWFAAKSTDSGNSFTYINPYTFFPSVNGGFCCDQVTAYAPAQDMALWGLQYIDDGNTNTLRIARAIGAAGIAANSWTYWSFTPQMVGFANGIWFDYPSFTVGATHLYVTSNAFFTSNNLFAGNVVMRIPLAQLAAGGTINFSYFRSGIGTERLTEGAGTTMYWAGFTTTAQMRIHRWDDASGTVFWDNVNLNAFNYLSRDGIATSPDGTNWALRADSRPTAAYVAGGIIGVMWSAKQGVGRPKPYTVHARFSQATRALVTQSDIWHTDYAWMYPAASPNSAGYLAGTLQIGGAASGTFAYPGTQIFITDDVTGAANGVGALYYMSSSNDGPNNNAWGDFFSVRPHKTRTRTWVGASHTLVNGGGGANTIPKYFWFGRERDNPIAAAMVSPAPGSTLAGSSQTFTWNTGVGSLQYWLYVGTTGVGSYNLYTQDQGTATSRLVTGLPTNGATLYVRLWTRSNLGWDTRDYTYTAATAVVRAALISPAPGSTLAGASVPFSWTTGTGALQYWLYVGTSVGASNIWNQDQGTATSRTVTGLPTDGSTVYTRLWTRFTSGWQFNDYTHTAAAATCVAAAMTSPAAGSMLAGSSVPFTWNAGTGNSQYWLYVGTSFGGTQIWNQNQGTGLSRTVTGIPTNGSTIHVTLWSFCGGTWHYRTYTYTARTVRARLTSPADHAVLAGATQVFDWVLGSGTTQVYLYVGNSRGAADIWNQNQGTAVTRTVTGIPIDGRRIYVRLWSLISGLWYYVDYEFTAAGTTRARLTSPAEGSVLPGTSATFNWAAGSGASSYWIYVGSTVGGSQYWAQGLGTGLTATVTGLPADHRPIYVRLWSFVAGAWVYNDYEFNAFDGGSVRGRIVSPVEGAILDGTSNTITLAAGSGATQYWIYVGNAVGNYTYFNQNLGTSLSVTATGLPTNGSTVYVRLWSLIGGAWQWNDYTYIAAP
jgi:hypothetical protein